MPRPGNSNGSWNVAYVNHGMLDCRSAVYSVSRCCKGKAFIANVLSLSVVSAEGSSYKCEQVFIKWVISPKEHITTYPAVKNIFLSINLSTWRLSQHLKSPTILKRINLFLSAIILFHLVPVKPHNRDFVPKLVKSVQLVLLHQDIHQLISSSFLKT